MKNKESTAPKTRCFVTTVSVDIAEKLRRGLEDQSFLLSTPPYTLFSGKKKGVTCTLYQSGKLVVQGKAMGEFIEFYLEPEILGDFSYTYQELSIDKTPRIGIDESGKGDFFGPLCIAGVYAGNDDIEKLCRIGVKDSKAISDKKIHKLAKEIRSLCSWHVVKLTPIKYNELYASFRNLNSLLAWGHATTIENLVEQTQCTNVIIDQFASEHVVESALRKKNVVVNLKQRHRAESDHVVAAASILARAAFLDELERLSEDCSITLPKGASRAVIEAGKRFAAKYGNEAFCKVAKLHFKTYRDITS